MSEIDSRATTWGDSPPTDDMEAFWFNVLMDAKNNYSEMAATEKPEPDGNKETYETFEAVASWWLHQDRFSRIRYNAALMDKSDNPQSKEK